MPLEARGLKRRMLLACLLILFLKFPSWQFLYDINAPLSQLSLCMARFDNIYYIYILYELNVKGKGKHGRIRLDRFIGEPGWQGHRAFFVFKRILQCPFRFVAVSDGEPWTQTGITQQTPSPLALATRIFWTSPLTQIRGSWMHYYSCFSCSS